MNNLAYLALSGPPATALTATMTAEAMDGLGRFCQANRMPLPSGTSIDAAAAARLEDAHDTSTGDLEA